MGREEVLGLLAMCVWSAPANASALTPFSEPPEVLQGRCSHFLGALFEDGGLDTHSRICLRTSCIHWSYSTVRICRRN
jgi:hypothetical protein